MTSLKSKWILRIDSGCSLIGSVLFFFPMKYNDKKIILSPRNVGIELKDALGLHAAGSLLRIPVYGPFLDDVSL